MIRSHKSTIMKNMFFLIAFLLAASCIPYKIAPNIEDYKIVYANKFKRDLPGQYAFVFEDDKEVDEFYHFVNTKFELQHENVMSDVPFKVKEQTYYMSFHEREKTTETVNFLPLLIDGFISAEGNDPVLEEVYTSGTSYWYILITVRDSSFNDCLAPTFIDQKEVILFLRLLNLEYQGNQSFAGVFPSRLE